MVLMIAVLLGSLLLPTALSTSFGSNSALIILQNVWDNVTERKMSLAPGETYRVYAVQSSYADNDAYTTNVIIAGADNVQFSVASLTKPKAGTHYILDESNILTAPITVTDTNPAAAPGVPKRVAFTIYFVSAKIPASPVISAQFALHELQTEDGHMYSSRAKLSSASCTVLSAESDMELSEITSSSAKPIEVKVAGYDALAPQYTVMTVRKEAAGSRVIIDGPIATLYNPEDAPTDFSLYVHPNAPWSEWAGAIAPGASTAFLSQGWLSVNESYDMDGTQDLYPFMRGYSFMVNGKLEEAMVTIAPVLGNYFPPDDSCEISCGGINGMQTPYNCAELSGGLKIACCTSININVHYKGSKTGPRFMVQVDSEKATISCYDFNHPTTTSSSTTKAITTTSAKLEDKTTVTSPDSTTSATSSIEYSLLLVASLCAVLCM